MNTPLMAQSKTSPLSLETRLSTTSRPGTTKSIAEEIDWEMVPIIIQDIEARGWEWSKSMSANTSRPWEALVMIDVNRGGNLVTSTEGFYFPQALYTAYTKALEYEQERMLLQSNISNAGKIMRAVLEKHANG